MAKQVMVNGKNYDWGDVQAVAFGVPLVGITNISYTETQSTVNNKGAGHQPVSYGKKGVEYTGGKMTLYLEEVRAIAQNAPDKNILNVPLFTMPVIFSGNGVPYAQDNVNNIRFTSNPLMVKSDDTAIMCDITFDFAGIDRT